MDIEDAMESACKNWNIVLKKSNCGGQVSGVRTGSLLMSYSSNYWPRPCSALATTSYYCFLSVIHFFSHYQA